MDKTMTIFEKSSTFTSAFSAVSFARASRFFEGGYYYYYFSGKDASRKGR